jgi:hypothetical protein
MEGVLVKCDNNVIAIVATLNLGSQPRQRFAKVQDKSEARESHFMLPGGLGCRRM